MVCKWCANGESMVCKWCANGLKIWCANGVQIWCANGESMVSASMQSLRSASVRPSCWFYERSALDLLTPFRINIHTILPHLVQGSAGCGAKRLHRCAHHTLTICTPFAHHLHTIFSDHNTYTSSFDLFISFIFISKEETWGSLTAPIRNPEMSDVPRNE